MPSEHSQPRFQRSGTWASYFLLDREQRFFNLASRTPPPPPSALHLPDERLTVYQSSRSHGKLSPTARIVFSRRCHFDPLPLTITAWGSHQRWVNLQREFLSPSQRLGRVRVLRYAAIQDPDCVELLDATVLWIAPTALRRFSLTNTNTLSGDDICPDRVLQTPSTGLSLRLDY